MNEHDELRSKFFPNKKKHILSFYTYQPISNIYLMKL
jgi:hypothetical protein